MNLFIKKQDQSGDPTLGNHDVAYYLIQKNWHGTEKQVGICLLSHLSHHGYERGAERGHGHPRGTYMLQRRLSANTVHIDVLFINKKYRGQGFGMALIEYVLQDQYAEGKYYVELEDVSDRSGKEDCIYPRAGLHYTSDDNSMRGNLRHIRHRRSKPYDRSKKN